MNNKTNAALTSHEKRTLFGLALIYAFRMLGLFMILPVFALEAKHYYNVTPSLIGLALGIYGLTQGLLQIPFGLTSDRIGRKPVILAGLCIFALGSLIATFTHSIYGLIIGRGIQGAGAIGSTNLALLADATRPSVRTKSMAIIGMTIGCSFALAFIIGPVINSHFQLSGIFATTAICAICGIVVLFTLVPHAPPPEAREQKVLSQFVSTIRKPALLCLDYGIFCQHAILTSLFLVLPRILNHHHTIKTHHLWKIYCPVLIGAFFLMMPLIYLAERRKRLHIIFPASILVMGLSIFLMYLCQLSFWSTVLALLLYFICFNYLESSLPSIISKLAPPEAKGTAMGIYSSAQFLGIFAGGALGGLLNACCGLNGVLIACAFLTVTWFIPALLMPYAQLAKQAKSDR